MKATREDVAWAAGFIEGDGCFNVYKRKREHGDVYTEARIVISNTDLELLKTIKRRLLGYGSIGCVQKEGTVSTTGVVSRCDAYQLAISSRQARTVAQLIFPYMVGLKREKLLGEPLVWRVSLDQTQLDDFRCIKQQGRDNGSKQEKLAWAAGFIEADGYFGLKKVKLKRCIKRYAVIGAANTDMKLLRTLQRILRGYGCINLIRNKGSINKTGVKTNHDVYQFGVSGRRARIIAQLLFPYIVGSKRDKLLKFSEVFRIPTGDGLY